MKPKNNVFLRRIMDLDNLLLILMAGAILIIILNSCCLLATGRSTRAGLVDLTGGLMALTGGIFVHRRKRSLTDEVERHARKNAELAAQVAERTDLLTSTNSFLETLVQDSPLAVVVLDLDWKVRVWSPMAERIFGWSADETVGQSVPYIPADRQKEWEEILMGRLQGGENNFYDVQRQAKDGSLIELSAWTSPLHGTSEAVFGYLLIYADNRERKAAEEALRKSEERFALFLDNIPGYALLKDAEGRYLYTNKGCRQFYSRFGIPDPLHRTDHELWPADIAERFCRNDREVLQAMKPIQFIEPVPLDDGTDWHFLMNKFPVEDHNGKTILCAIGIDISELRDAEKALAELQALQEALLENIPDVVWLKQLDGRYLSVNNAFGKVTGLSRREIEGKTDQELWPDEQAAFFKASDLQVVALKTQCRFEEQILMQDGEVRWFETLKKPLCNDEGEIIGTTGISRDMTDRKRDDEKLHAYQEQLAALAAELSLAEERERRRISAELHDQIGQSLALGKMKLNALAAAPTDAERSEFIAELKETLDHCIREVRSLTSQISPPLLYEIGLEPALEWLCEWMGDNYTLQVEMRREGPPVILPDEIRGALFRIVRELLINCAKHAGSSSATVSCRRFSDRLEITVTDSGTGFDTAELDTRGHLGFGLFSIRQRIRYMGGECRIDSAPGRGTTVALHVPLASGMADDRR